METWYSCGLNCNKTPQKEKQPILGENNEHNVRKPN